MHGVQYLVNIEYEFWHYQGEIQKKILIFKFIIEEM